MVGAKWVRVGEGHLGGLGYNCKFEQFWRIGMVGADVGAGGRMVGADVPGGPSPARNAAGRPTTEPRVGVGCRRARGTRAPTNVGVLMCQGQPTWEARADTPRRGRLGYFARRAVGGRLCGRAVGGVLVDGGAGPDRDKRGPPVWPRV